MIAVIDTNVLLRASLRPEGSAYALFTLLREAPNEIILSTFILSELHRIMHYPRLKRSHQKTDQEIEQTVKDFASHARILNIGVDIHVPSVSRDPDDDYVIWTAIEGGADVICSLDEDLHTPMVVTHCVARGIRVMTDIELLHLLRSQMS